MHRFTAAFLALLALPASADLAIEWYSIDGGGAAASSASYVLVGVSGQPDASTLAGSSLNIAGGFWAWDHSRCVACAADYNSDGGIDGADVEAFFASWEAGESCADVNTDGGIDGADVEFFFSVWENGGC